MKKFSVLTVLLLTLCYIFPADAYRPKYPNSPYYFMSKDKRYLAEITPTVMHSKDSKYLLVKASQAISIYKKSDNNSWKEESSFRVEKMHLIREVLLSNNGKIIVIRIDENPTGQNTNKDDGLFIFSVGGKMLKSYSHFSIFDRPGNFRNVKLDIDDKQNELVITDKDKVTKLTLPK